MKAKKGFTLVELMITVAILAILGAIAIPLYNGYITDSRKAEAKASLQALRTLEEQYLADTGEYVSGADTAALKTALEGFRPGDEGSLYYSYEVDADVTDGKPVFTAKASLKSDTSKFFTIDQDNVRKDENNAAW